jgi:hypothetical protein
MALPTLLVVHYQTGYDVAFGDLFAPLVAGGVRASVVMAQAGPNPVPGDHFSSIVDDRAESRPDPIPDDCFLWHDG